MESETSLEDAPEESGDEAAVQTRVHGRIWRMPSQLRKFRQFPFAVFFIMATEVCERFATRGSFRAVLSLYLRTQLGFSDNRTTVIYHSFIMFSYFLTILGALVSDSCLGKYWTILFLSATYALGNITITLSAMPWGLQTEIALTVVAMVIIILGMGGIKSCVAAFGGDQFKEDQKDLLSRFFSIFYFTINIGAATAALFVPLLRSSVQCFGSHQCFPLAFGIPSILVIISIVIFLAGTRFYIIHKPKREAAFLFYKVPASIVVAIYCRLKQGLFPPHKKHFLHYADHKFSHSFLEDVRLLLRVLVMMAPLPLWWSLSDQMGSRWTLQAARMNGRLGGIVIQPDQLAALNPVFILLLIPIFETVIYPICAKCHLFIRPLQRMVAGLLIMIVTFVLAGVVELQVAAADSSLGAGEGKAIFTNTLPETLRLQLQNTSFDLSHGESYSFRPPGLGNYSFSVMDTLEHMSTEQSIELTGQNVNHVLIAVEHLNFVFAEEKYRENIPATVNISIQIFNMAGAETEDSIDFLLCTEQPCEDVSYQVDELYFLDHSNQSNVSAASFFYRIKKLNSNDSFDQRGELKGVNGGGVYAIIVLSDTASDQYNVTTIEVAAPSSVSVLLQVPMYLTGTISEILLCVSAVEFAYSQAPASMKALCQAAWLWTIALGNLVTIIIVEANLFESQAAEFFFFSGIITVVAILYSIMSYFYKYVDITHDSRYPLPRGAINVKREEDEGALLEQDEEEASSVVNENFTEPLETGL